MRASLALSIPAVAIAIAAGYLVLRFSARELSLQSADFRNAASAEIRDRQGTVVLRGTFVLEEEEDDDVEREAALADPGGGEPMGEAEVEFAAVFPVEQEVEFSARGLQPGATYTLVVDGHELVAVAADERGRIAIELDVPLPGAPASR